MIIGITGPKGAGKSSALIRLAEFLSGHGFSLGGRTLLLKSGKIIADGASEQVITPDALCDLYNLPESFAENTAARCGQGDGFYLR